MSNFIASTSIIRAFTLIIFANKLSRSCEGCILCTILWDIFHVLFKTLLLNGYDGAFKLEKTFKLIKF